jgi:hypothetical protein
MTGFKSKRAAALDEEGMYLVHQTAQPEQELIVGTKTWFEDGKVITQHLTAKEVYKEPAQWDTPSEAFNAWWDGEYDDSTNPFTKDTFAYWAFAGWKAALAQPEQEPKSVTYKEVADTMNALRKGNFSQKAAAEEVGKLKLYTTPPQRPWVDLTGNEWFEWWRVSPIADSTEAEIDFADFLIIAQAVVAKLKENNNG